MYQKFTVSWPPARLVSFPALNLRQQNERFSAPDFQLLPFFRPDWLYTLCFWHSASVPHAYIFDAQFFSDGQPHGQQFSRMMIIMHSLLLSFIYNHHKMPRKKFPNVRFIGDDVYDDGDVVMMWMMMVVVMMAMVMWCWW